MGGGRFKHHQEPHDRPQQPEPAGEVEHALPPDRRNQEPTDRHRNGGTERRSHHVGDELGPVHRWNPHRRQRMNGRPGGAQEEPEHGTQNHHRNVVRVGGERRQQGQQAGKQHAVPEHAPSTDDFRQPTTGQLRQHVAPEEAAKHQVLLPGVPLELVRLIDHGRFGRGVGQVEGVGRAVIVTGHRADERFRHRHDRDRKVYAQRIVQHEAEDHHNVQHLPACYPSCEGANIGGKWRDYCFLDTV